MIDVPPTPSGEALIVSVLCTDAPRDETGEERLVTILDDWTVYAPDLDVEADSVARALGAWSPLLHFVESIVPAYRHALQVMWNPRSLGRRDGRWGNTTQGGCRQTEHLHVSLKNAVRHELSTDHGAFLFESHEWRIPDVRIAAWNQYFDLMSQARNVWVEDATRGESVTFDEALTLWKVGLLPHRDMMLEASDEGSGVLIPMAYMVDRYFHSLENETRVGRR